MAKKSKDEKKFKIEQGLFLQSADEIEARFIMGTDERMRSSRRITLSTDVLPDGFGDEAFDFEGTIIIEGTFKSKEE